MGIYPLPGRAKEGFLEEGMDGNWKPGEGIQIAGTSSSCCLGCLFLLPALLLLMACWTFCREVLPDYQFKTACLGTLCPLILLSVFILSDTRVFFCISFIFSIRSTKAEVVSVSDHHYSDIPLVPRSEPDT